MNVRFLTLHHKLSRSLVQPTHTSSQMNLSLVVGTSNNLYKGLHETDAGSQAKINSIIIELWLEKIYYLLEKLTPLEQQVEKVSPKNPGEPLYIRIEYLEENQIAHHLSGLIERLDRTLMSLQHLGDSGMDSEKYDRFLLYFGDKVSELLHFPYQQTPELHQRILRSQL